MRSELATANSPDQELYTYADIQLGKERSRKINLLAATIAGSPDIPNEDAYAVAVHEDTLFVGVFDGTTSLKPIKSLGVQTGARFASHFLKDNFSHAQSTASPRELMLCLNQRLLQTSLTLEGASLIDPHTLPASFGTIICIDASKDTLAFAHVGDSFGVAYYADSHSRVFTNDKNSVFDAQMLALIARIAKERGITPRQARQDERVKKALIEMVRARNNNPHGTGCGLINGDPNIERYMHVDTFALAGVAAILLGSDGLVPPGWSLSQEPDRQSMLNQIHQGGFAQLFATKKQREDQDQDWQQLRYKHSDDATGVLLSFNS